MPIKVTTHLAGLVKDEKLMLRTELQSLKDCQIRFLSSAVVSVGVILGLPGVFKPQPGGELIPGAYLVPLVVLMPCWWGFFDKAKTITRIVGYFRILEEIALTEVDGLAVGIEQFIGWENSVSKYRSLERDGMLPRDLYSKPSAKEVAKAIVLAPSQRYWLLAHYTFFILCFLCIAIAFAGIWQKPLLFSLQGVLAVASLFVFLYSCAWNTAILWALMWERHSYSATQDHWRSIFARTPEPVATKFRKPAAPEQSAPF